MRPRRPIAIPVLLASSLLGACGSSAPKPDPHSMAPTTIDKQVVGRTTLSMPIPILGQSTVIVPFAIESEKDWFQTRDPYAAGGFGRTPASLAADMRKVSSAYGLTAAPGEGDYSTPPDSRRWATGGSGVRWHNAILRDTKSAEEWPILDKRGVISSWSWFGSQPRRDTPFVAKFLLFIATTEDTNHDGLLNDLDARVAIVTDAAGRHPRVVSPPTRRSGPRPTTPRTTGSISSSLRTRTATGSSTTPTPPCPTSATPRARARPRPWSRRRCSNAWRACSNSRSASLPRPFPHTSRTPTHNSTSSPA